MAAKNFKEKKVYKLAYEQAMEVFELTKLFPKKKILTNGSGQKIFEKCLHKYY